MQAGLERASTTRSTNDAQAVVANAAAIPAFKQGGVPVVESSVSPGGRERPELAPASRAFSGWGLLPPELLLEVTRNLPRGNALQCRAVHSDWREELQPLYAQEPQPMRDYGVHASQVPVQYASVEEWAEHDLIGLMRAAQDAAKQRGVPMCAQVLPGVQLHLARQRINTRALWPTLAIKAVSRFRNIHPECVSLGGAGNRAHLNERRLMYQERIESLLRARLPDMMYPVGGLDSGAALLRGGEVVTWTVRRSAGPAGVEEPSQVVLTRPPSFPGTARQVAMSGTRLYVLTDDNRLFAWPDGQPEAIVELTTDSPPLFILPVDTGMLSTHITVQCEDGSLSMLDMAASDEIFRPGGDMGARHLEPILADMAAPEQTARYGGLPFGFEYWMAGGTLRSPHSQANPMPEFDPGSVQCVFDWGAIGLDRESGNLKLVCLGPPDARDNRQNIDLSDSLPVADIVGIYPGFRGDVVFELEDGRFFGIGNPQFGERGSFFTFEHEVPALGETPVYPAASPSGWSAGGFGWAAGILQRAARALSGEREFEFGSTTAAVMRNDPDRTQLLAIGQTSRLVNGRQMTLVRCVAASKILGQDRALVDDDKEGQGNEDLWYYDFPPEMLKPATN